MRGSVIAWTALLATAFALVTCGHPARGATPPKRGEKTTILLRVYKPNGDWCTFCKDVEAELAKRKVKTVGVCRVIQDPPYYPLCVYSDGSTDSGDKIFRGECRFAREVKLITVMEPKERKK
jgi:hypothetical protein